MAETNFRVPTDDIAYIEASGNYCDVHLFNGGFEPPVPLGTTVFKTVVIDHSTISPIG